jgi:hypothetical protein
MREALGRPGSLLAGGRMRTARSDRAPERMTKGKLMNRLRTGLILCLALLVFLACGGGGTVTVVITPTVTSTPTASCATLVPGATAATAPSSFAGLQFPSGAVMTSLQAAAGGTGQFLLDSTNVCYHGTVDQVNGPYSGHSSVFAYLLGSGWGYSTFPADGLHQAACGSGVRCFRSSPTTNPEHYLAFDHLTSPTTGYVTYRLRLATPPTTPSCNPTFYASRPYIYGFLGYAVPPLTKESDTAAGGGYAGGYAYGLCSAGTPATILAFMRASAMAAGQTVLNSTATGFNTCVPGPGHGSYQEIIFGVSSGNEWEIRVSIPIFTTPTCS